jgi:hypothetical protein
MTDGSYEDGYRDGWEGIAGERPIPEPLTYPPEGEARDYQAGFLYGRAEAALHFKPGTSDRPPEPTGL